MGQAASAAECKETTLTHLALIRPKGLHALNRAQQRAFVYGGGMKRGRPDILRYPRDALAHSLALRPVGAQIAVVTRLGRHARARLAQDCVEWVSVVPILQMTPTHRHYTA